MKLQIEREALLKLNRQANEQCKRVANGEFGKSWEVI